MFAINNGLRGTSRISSIVSRTYCNTIVSTPPRVKVSTAEKIFALFCIVGSTLGLPMYMVPRFKIYGANKLEG